MRAWRRVAERVLEQVDREAVELVARGLDDRRLGVDDDFVLVADRPELRGRLDDDRGEVARLAARHAPHVRACEQQQVGHEPAHALRGAERRSRRLALVAVE